MLHYYASASLLIASTACTDKKDEPKNELTSPSTKTSVKTQEEKSMSTPQRITTSSGLKYDILKKSPDDAKMAVKGNKVAVHYTGWLADENGKPKMDTKFDSSYDRNQPIEFILGTGRVIKGWDEGVEGMKIGEKRLLIIPADLAYGNRAMGKLIPANSPLVFEVELIDIK